MSAFSSPRPSKITILLKVHKKKKKKSSSSYSQAADPVDYPLPLLLPLNSREIKIDHLRTIYTLAHLYSPSRLLLPSVRTLPQYNNVMQHLDRPNFVAELYTHTRARVFINLERGISVSARVISSTGPRLLQRQSARVETNAGRISGSPSPKVLCGGNVRRRRRSRAFRRALTYIIYIHGEFRRVYI